MPVLSTILLIDDDSTTNFLNERLLLRMGVSQQVLVATNGQQGLDLLQAHCYSGSTDCPLLVLLDLNMPVMNGQEFLEMLGRRPLGGHPIVVVLLTSSQHDQDLARFQHLPVADFLPKPLTREKVADMLDRYFPDAPV